MNTQNQNILTIDGGRPMPASARALGNAPSSKPCAVIGSTQRDRHDFVAVERTPGTSLESV